MYSTFVLLFAAVVALASAHTADDCPKLCNEVKFDVLTLAMCRDAKKTLPKPKVGDYCTVAMEQGFSDACFGLCTNQPPVNRVSQTCRAASMEMPRPTVRRWCEHGYNVAFDKTVQDLKTYFTAEATAAAEKLAALGPVAHSIPITLDNTMHTLEIHENENAEDALAAFCTANAADDTAGCIRHLLPVVLERLQEA